MNRSRWPILVLTAIALSACGDDGDPSPETDTGVDAVDAGDDAEVSDAGDADTDDDSIIDTGDDAYEVPIDTDDGSGDADTDVEEDPTWPETPRFTRYAERPAAGTYPEALAPCAVVGEEECTGEIARVCAVWDVEAGDWAADVPRMADQAFWYDRYYDLYHDIEGMTVDLIFTAAMPPGTPESEWTAPEVFEQMDAYGDASGWSGTAVFGAAARYQTTGSPADYERMVTMLEGMMFLYEVTDIPGVIARSHFGLLPEGAPRPVGHWGKALSPWFSDDGTGWHFQYPIGEDHLERLPEYYDGEVMIGETGYETEPRWMGDASRDMYVRSTPGVLLALDLLGEGEREDRLREVAALELPCTLNRMKHGRIVNLQSRPDLVDAVTTFLGSGNLVTEPGDADFSALDTLVFFAMEQPNPAHMELFDPNCPDGPPLEPDPDYVLDAESPQFLLDMLQLFGRVGRTANAPIAWIQAPSVRAADLLYMLQWALTAHYLTDDERYLEFVDMMTSDTDFAGVLRTYGSFQLPKWCQSHYAPSLSYPTLYNLLARIDREAYPETWDLLSEVATTEGREKEMNGRGDAYWGVLYNRMWSEAWDEDGAEYVAEHVEILRGYGFTPEDAREPDRNHTIDWTDPPVDGLELEYPTDDDIEVCETPIEVLGLELPAPGMSDEGPRAVEPLPVSMRFGSGFMWTGDPWRVVRSTGSEYTKQYPMLGMTVPYWVGRADGVIDDGAGLVLALKNEESACATE